MVSRRIFLGGALAGLAQAAGARPPDTSLRPMPRPEGLWRRALPSVEATISETNPGGRIAFAVADARSGAILEMRDGLVGMPPASTAKAITCAYGLDRLGPGYRFRTQVLASGPIRNGRLDGDLWLVGGGDPLMQTDDLVDLARQVHEAGLREVTGDLRLDLRALPTIRQIDPDQPPHVGYNPSVGALNLNFNRVHFQWERSGEDYSVQMDARSETIRPPVQGMRMRIEDRGAPVYTYDLTDRFEEWTVARAALGNGGSRWLPVRRPARYTAEVFQLLTRSRGLVLSGPRLGGRPPSGAQPIAELLSPPLEEVLGGMMRWSTNITAEVVGLSASRAGGAAPRSLAASGREMSEWMRGRLGARRPDFVDHSGLGEESRLRAQDMALALAAAGPDSLLRQLMKPVIMRDRSGNAIEGHPVRAVAKTGTLNFVSTLAGYVTSPSGRDLAFAIFCADIPRREALADPQMERPEGGRVYNRRAKATQQALIERWAEVYAEA